MSPSGKACGRIPYTDGSGFAQNDKIEAESERASCVRYEAVFSFIEEDSQVAQFKKQHEQPKSMQEQTQKGKAMTTEEKGYHKHRIQTPRDLHIFR